MNTVIEKSAKLGIKIEDHRNLGMTLSISNKDTWGCTLACNSTKCYINVSGTWYFAKEDMDRFIEKFKALSELVPELNKEYFSK